MSVEELADELFIAVERAQGFAFISDAEGASMMEDEFFERVRGRLAWSEESCRIIRKFLRDHQQLKARHRLELTPIL
jgi:hypothetical protein